MKKLLDRSRGNLTILLEKGRKQQFFPDIIKQEYDRLLEENNVLREEF